MSKPITITVYGIPRPGGSKRGFIIRGGGRPDRIAMTDASGEKGKDWRGDVKHAALKVTKAVTPFPSGPLHLTVTFYMPRLKSHYKANNPEKGMRPDAPVYHTMKPDATKLLRSVEDALTGIVWKDDAQIAYQVVRKVYREQSGAEIVVEELT